MDSKTLLHPDFMRLQFFLFMHTEDIGIITVPGTSTVRTVVVPVVQPSIIIRSILKTQN